MHLELRRSFAISSSQTDWALAGSSRSSDVCAARSLGAMTLRLAATATVGEVAFGGVGSLRFGFFPSESSAARLPQRHVSSVRRPKSVRQCSLTAPFFASSGRCMRESFPVRRLWVRRLATEASTSQASEGHEGGSTEGAPEKQTPYYFNQEALGDAEEEVLSPQEKAEKEQLVKLLAKKLAGPLADENGNVPTGESRQVLHLSWLVQPLRNHHALALSVKLFFRRRPSHSD